MSSGDNGDKVGGETGDTVGFLLRVASEQGQMMGEMVLIIQELVKERTGERSANVAELRDSFDRLAATFTAHADWIAAEVRRG